LTVNTANTLVTATGLKDGNEAEHPVKKRLWMRSVDEILK